MPRLEKPGNQLCVLKLDGLPAMSPMKKLPVLLLTGLFILTACTREPETATTPVSAPPSPALTPTETKPQPPPSSPGDSIIWENLQVTLDQLEITEDYSTNYRSRRVPPAGKKFLWVHIRL